MSTKPVIGILLDWQDSGTFSKRPHYALRQGYFDAISAVGGMPVGLSYDENHMLDYLDLIDGLLCPGGNFASPAHWYVDGEETPYGASPRAEYEVEFITRALDKGKPILGICGGMQVLGASQGCKFTGDLHAYYKTENNYKNGTPAEDFAFTVNITQGTRLHDIVGNEVLKINAAHREAIVEHPEHVTVSALSVEDHIVQAIELPEHKFAIGVQWHPEFFISDDKGQTGHRKVFEALVKTVQI